MNSVKYSIRDLERISGIRAHTIRMWEKRYGIILPERTSTNIRFYSDKNLQKLLNISILNKNGFRISQISELSDTQIIEDVAHISDSTDSLDADINIMIMAAIDLQEELFEKTLNSSILKIGFERTFCELIFPLMLKIGVFWQIGRINACQERFISNLVRQKLLVAIDGLVGQTIMEPKSFLLFLPSGEYNEIGLLFANYLVRKSGHQVVYLGPSVPLEHLERLADQTKFNEILINITLQQSEKELKSYFDSLKNNFPSQEIHVIFSDENPKFSLVDIPNLHIYNSFAQFSGFVGQQ